MKPQIDKPDIADGNNRISRMNLKSRRESAALKDALSSVMTSQTRFLTWFEDPQRFAGYHG